MLASMNVMEIFENIAERYSGSVAIAYNDRLITYKKLNENANILANYLTSQGIKNNDAIGLFLNRSPEFIISILAIIKIGAMYVPLDTSYPDERIKLMIDDANISLLVSNLTNKEKVAHYNIRKFCFGEDDNLVVRDTTAVYSKQVNENTPAYVMYTSGSTGVPKGAIIPHRSIIRLAVDTDFVQISPSDNFAHLSNISFDASTFEIWCSLLNGARITIIDNITLLDTNEFYKCIVRNEITSMFVTVALFNHLVSEKPDIFKTVRYVIFGGEKATPKFIAEVVKHGKPRHLINGYGPTENTVFSTTYEVHDVLADAISIPIGKAIKGTSTYILNKNLSPVDKGQEGELFLGGPGVALGYLNRPELTEEAFIKNPDKESKDTVLYKTGDIVRELPDGNIDFLRRMDGQVKLRGFRIELHEIELTIASHPSVRQAFVMLAEGHDNEKQIVAFFRPCDNDIDHHDIIRSYLIEKLPGFMLPWVIIQVTNFPITPNGKIDTIALSNIVEGKQRFEKLQMPKEASEEELMKHIWEEIFCYHPIKPDDNFIELGGHSFLAFQIIGRIKEVFAIDLPLRFVFESPTIAGLAKRLIEYKKEYDRNKSCVLPIQTMGNRIPVYMVPPFEYIHPLYGLLNNLEADQPVYVLEPAYFSIDDTKKFEIQDIATMYVLSLIHI